MDEGMGPVMSEEYSAELLHDPEALEHHISNACLEPAKPYGPENHFTFVKNDIAWIFGDSMWIHTFEDGSRWYKCWFGFYIKEDQM
jgi:hypothetical protein